MYVCVCVYSVYPGGDRHTRRRRFFSQFYFPRTRLPLINIIILFMNANKRPPAREMRRLRSAETAETLRACASAPTCSIIIYARRTQTRPIVSAKQTNRLDSPAR